MNPALATHTARLLRRAGRLTTVTFVAVACIARAQLSLAQRSRQLDSAIKQMTIEELMNLKVTSVSKRSERLSDVASAIQVITQGDIHRSGATSLPEALRLAANLQVAKVDSRQWGITARGFNSTSANKLLVLMDGRTLYTPLYSGVFWDVQDVDLEDIERVEVISGPGGVLWGANAVNGVINIITKNAKDTEGLVVKGGGGSTLRGFGEARYGGAIAPSIHFRTYAKTYGRKPSVFPSGGDAADGTRTGQLGFRMDGDVTEQSHWSLLGDYYNGAAGQAGKADIGVSGGNVLGRWTQTISKQSEVQLQTYYDRTHRDIPGTFGEDLTTVDVDLQHRSEVGARQAVIWGIGFRYIDDTVTNTAVLAFLPARVGRRWLTAFAQDEITIVDHRLYIALGAKVEHNDYTGVELQPGARVTWKAREQQTLWSAVSRAVRAPSRIDRELFAPSAPPYQLAGNTRFVSEVLWAYEVGYRNQLARSALSVSTFFNSYDGVRSLERLDPAAAFPLVLGNGQRGTSYGAELAAEYRVSPVWKLKSGYTEMRLFIRPKPGSTDLTNGSTESHDPDRQGFLASSFDLPRRVTVDGRLRYVSEIVNQTVPAYSELDGRLAWRPKQAWELSVTGQNLLHANHPEFGMGAARRNVERAVLGSLTWRY